MFRTTIKKPILAFAFLTSIGSAHLHAEEAGDPIQQPSMTSQVQAQSQVVRGRDLMTAAERDAMRERMHAATSEAERARLRAENHAKMAQRAQERGLTLRASPGQHSQGWHGGRDKGVGGKPACNQQGKHAGCKHKASKPTHAED